MKKPAKIGKGKSKVKLSKEAKRKRLPPKSPAARQKKILKKFGPKTPKSRTK